MDWDQPDKKATAALRRQLLKWFDQHQRDLPWRKNKTAYRVWISEIMLQQTQVATVIDYYLRFIKRFPTVKKLAAAEVSEVLKLWEGLGYYRRARQLHAAAQRVVQQHNGVFPETFDDVLALPGIGRYTAGAILSIATDQRLPILEGNTIRLFARLVAMKSDPRSTANQKVLWHFAQQILPNKRCGDFNQSLMELGNQICKPKQPLCDQCPIASLCPTLAKGLQQVIPAKGKKRVYQDVREAVVLVSKTVDTPAVKPAGEQRKWLVRVCEPDQRWAGLWDFPRFAMDPQKTHSSNPPHQDHPPLGHLRAQFRDQTGFEATLVAVGRPIRHAVTRYRIELHCFEATQLQGRLKKQSTETMWATIDQLESLPMSVTGRKIAGRLKSLPLF